MHPWFVWYVPRPTFSKPAMESEGPWGVVDMHKYVQTRTEKLRLKAAQAGSFKRNQVP